MDVFYWNPSQCCCVYSKNAMFAFEYEKGAKHLAQKRKSNRLILARLRVCALWA